MILTRHRSPGRRLRHTLLWLALGLTIGGCRAHRADTTGLASWYGKAFRGRATASGEPFRPRKRTAAHRSLPFGTVLKVTVPATGKTVRVVVNDRGPHVEGRVLDLSRRAARRLGIVEQGVSQVAFQVVGCRKRRFDGPRSCSEAEASR